jgi:hypothetical protein
LITTLVGISLLLYSSSFTVHLPVHIFIIHSTTSRCYSARLLSFGRGERRSDLLQIVVFLSCNTLLQFIARIHKQDSLSVCMTNNNNIDQRSPIKLLLSLQNAPPHRVTCKNNNLLVLVKINAPNKIPIPDRR